MSEGKNRRGCLTAWLVLMIIANLSLALVYLLAKGFFARLPHAAPAWAFPVLAVGGILNVVFVIALFKWKKWGFYGLAAIAVVVAAVNLTVGTKLIQDVFGFLGLAILYGVLQIGKEKKGWAQLE